MGYTNCLMVSTMKELDLFDNIPYKYIKNIINRDDDDIEVEIEDLECDTIGYCKTRFTFKLNINVSGGCMPIMVDKKFVVDIEYNGSSCFGMLMSDLIEDDEEEEEQEEEEESDAEDDDWKYLCPNLHWGGQYGCDLCCYDDYIKDTDNQEMEAEWLNSKGRYCYKLHKKWLQDKKQKEVV